MSDETLHSRLDRQSDFDREPADVRERYYERARHALRDLLYCNRAWSAWGVGTMTQDDFVSADEDEDCVEDMALDLYCAVQEESS